MLSPGDLGPGFCAGLITFLLSFTLLMLRSNILSKGTYRNQECIEKRVYCSSKSQRVRIHHHHRGGIVEQQAPGAMAGRAECSYPEAETGRKQNSLKWRKLSKPTLHDVPSQELHTF